MIRMHMGIAYLKVSHLRAYQTHSVQAETGIAFRSILVYSMFHHKNFENKSILHMYCCGTRNSHPSSMFKALNKGNDKNAHFYLNQVEGRLQSLKIQH